MVLYHAISTYQILEVILHRLVINGERRAVLILPDFIMDKHKDYFQIVQLGIFNEVYLFPYLQIPHNRGYINQCIDDIYNKTVPHNIKSFENIYVAGVHFHFTQMLIKNNILFEVFEDAAGMIDKGQKIYRELHEKFPDHADIANDDGLFDMTNKYIKKVYVHQLSLRNKVEQEVFQVGDYFNKLTSCERENVLRFFHITEIKECDENYELLLTERFSVNGSMTEREQIDLYKYVVKKYLIEEKLVIKPHPDERIDYQQIFPKATVLPSNFPSELLDVIWKNKPKKMYAFNTTANKAIGENITMKRFDLKKIKEKVYEDNRCNSGKI